MARLDLKAIGRDLVTEMGTVVDQEGLPVNLVVIRAELQLITSLLLTG